MTLVAFATYGNRAEILTDTVHYGYGFQDFGYCTKTMLLPHLDAAVLTQGDHIFGDYTKVAALQASAQVETFDELVASAPRWLRKVADQADEEEGSNSDQCTAIFVGWSPSAQAFMGVVFASDRNDFEPDAMDGLWMMPTPWTARPNDLEQQRSLDELRRSHPRGSGIADLWLAKPLLAKPTTRKGWLELGLAVREQRTLDNIPIKVIVAGKLIHTVLRRGSSETKVLHTFDDEGDLPRLTKNTWHPFAQAVPCHCGNGKRSIDCHLREHFTEPCACRSTKTFGECCAIA